MEYGPNRQVALSELVPFEFLRLSMTATRATGGSKRCQLLTECLQWLILYIRDGVWSGIGKPLQLHLLRVIQQVLVVGLS